MISKDDLLNNKVFTTMLDELDLQVEDFTCLLCKDNEFCEYRFDPYNINGDCLGMK